MKKQSPPQVQLPPITIDESLTRYAGKVLFPAKLARANAALAQSGVPPRSVAPPATSEAPARSAETANARPKKAA